MALRGVVWLSLLAGVAALDVTPIEKVIELIEGLKSEVEADGAEEADTYGKFACFCKDTTMAKSKSVNKGHTTIDELSASIADWTSERAEKKTELADRQKKQEAWKK